jgi:hypothetical protein
MKHMSDEFISDLSMLGIDTASNEFMVFMALLQSAGGVGLPTTFGTMVPVLEEITERSFTKAYVYRCLATLEQQAMISVNSVHHPRQYSISEGKLRTTMKALKARKKKALEGEKEEIAKQLNRIRNIGPQEIALSITTAFSDPASSDVSIIIEGVENVRSTVIREFAESAGEGDTIRVMASMSTIMDGLGPGGTTEQRLLESAFKGVRVLGLITPSESIDDDIDLIVKFTMTLKDVVQSTVTTGNMQMRLGTTQVKTYRMVTLNDEKMLLYFTHGRESDVAALIQREDNPGLIDDAIATFNNLWETGNSVLDIINKRLADSKVQTMPQ